MKKTVKYMGILAAFTAAAVAAIFLLINKMELNQSELPEKEKILDIPDIVCWGDSLTEGVGGNGLGYPEILREKILMQLAEYIMDAVPDEESKTIFLDELYQMKVVNKGISGESSISIAARAGGIPMVNLSDINFNYFERKKEISFAADDGRIVEPWHSDKLEPVPVMINGITGTLYFNSEKYQYYFKRNNFGKQEYVPQNSRIMPLGLEEYEDFITVLFIGQNGGYLDYNDLILQQKSMIPEQIYKDGRYLVLGLTSGTEEERHELESVMEAEYGRNYINLREILSGDKVFEIIPELSREDISSMSIGEVPQCLRAPDDLVHLNEYGYEMAADAVFDRMMELGFFEDVKEKLFNYEK